MEKIISFEQEKKLDLQKKNLANKKSILLEKKKESEQSKKIQITQEEIGFLVWLYCPTCKTLEYSEIIHPKGRIHKCGTEVLEQKVTIDITAEYTICKRNLFYLEKVEYDFIKTLNKEKDSKKKQEIEILKNLIQELKKIELAMIAKLKKITQKEKLIAYLWVKDHPKFTTTIDSLGLAISNFRFQPEKRFENLIKPMKHNNEQEPLED